MAFFKFRKGGDDHAAAPSASAPESLEVMRKRARHRLIGAAVLVLLGVICFPLLFDSQPRPIAVDISIEIPDKNKVKPLRPPAPAASASVAVGVAAKPAASAEVVVAPSVVQASPVPTSRVAAGTVSSDGMITEYASKPTPKTPSKPEGKPVDKSAEKVADKAPPPDAPKSTAAAPTKDADKKPAAATEGRFIVQIGAFADGAKAHEARIKLERAGFKTYAQVIESKDGRRIRVRVGPFPNKHEAEKVGEKIKKLDLPVGILEL